MRFPLLRAIFFLLAAAQLQLTAVAAGKAAAWLWERHIGALVRGSPVVDGSEVIAGSFSGKIMALDLATGRPVWQFQAGNSVAVSPLVVGQRVYVAAADNYLYALDRGKGRLIWRRSLDAPGLYPLLVRGTTLVAATSDHLYGLAAESGERTWTVSLPQRLAAPPCAADDLLFIANRSAGIMALRFSDGSLVWSYVDPDYQTVSLAVANRLLYSASTDGRVRAMDPLLGKPRWQFRGRKPLRTGLGIATPLLLVALGSDLVALDQVSGMVVWKQALGAPAAVAAIESRQRVYVLDRLGMLSVLRLADGHELTRFNAGLQLTTTPAVGTERLYFGTRDGKVVALGGVT